MNVRLFRQSCVKNSGHRMFTHGEPCSCVCTWENQGKKGGKHKKETKMCGRLSLPADHLKPGVSYGQVTPKVSALSSDQAKACFPVALMSKKVGWRWPGLNARVQGRKRDKKEGHI